MQKTMKTTVMGYFKVQGLKELKKEMETTIKGCIGTITRIHSCFPS